MSFCLVSQGAVGLAIWVAAVGAKLQKFYGPKVPERGLLPDGSGGLPGGRVWRRVSRIEGQGSDVELITLSSDDDPNAIYISEETLMNECKVCILSKFDISNVWYLSCTFGCAHNRAWIMRFVAVSIIMSSLWLKPVHIMH